MTTNPPTGFTLVETLVAVLLLTMTIILPYYAIQRSLTATFSARDDLIASGLAQEAVEYVRGVRDHNYLAGRASADWLYGLDGGSTGERNCVSNYCTVDATRGSEVSLAIAQCQQPQSGVTPCIERPIYLSTSVSYYRHIVEGTKTRFVRYIRIEPVGSTGTVVKVTSTVTWTYRGTHTITVTDYLTNWL